MYSESDIIEMETSFNCYVLSNNVSEVYSVDIYSDNRNKRFVQIDKKNIFLNVFKILHLKNYICDMKEVSGPHKNRVKLYKVNVDEKRIEDDNISTEDDIVQKLNGKEMKDQALFSSRFKDELANNNIIIAENIHIIAIIPISTVLERKRPITEEEETTESKRSKWETKKWDTNGAIRTIQRAGVYFIDPLELSGPLLDKILEGEFMALYGARATGKTTRVFRVMEQLEAEGFLCIYLSLEVIGVIALMESEKFWSLIGEHIVYKSKDPHFDIKSSGDFSKLFLKSQNKWGEKKVVLFIDEYDVMYTTNNEIRSSFLQVVRGIKATKEEYAIWSINIVGPFSILHLSSEEVATSPFNVKEPFQNPNFTQEQVLFLFNEYAKDEQITIDQEVIKDIYMRTNGHAGLVTNCGKAIHEKLRKELNESYTLNISIWLKFTASNRLEGAIRNYETFRRMIERLVEKEMFRPAIDFFRSSFAGFLGPIKINDSKGQKLANFLTAEGVLTVVDKDDNVYKMSSAFMDELMRRRVISEIYKSCPESAIPVKDDESLDTLNILQMAIQFFDKTIISNGFTRSFKIANGLYVDGKTKKKVPRESVYDIELNRILVNWLVIGSGYEVTGQWHLVEEHDNEKDKHSYSDIVITAGCQKIVLELLATASKKDLEEHFERVLKYAELLSADEIWIVHFTCEDGYAAQKLQWPSDGKINVIHIFHDRKLNNLIMNAQYSDGAGIMKYIVDQAVSLQS